MRRALAPALLAAALLAGCGLEDKEGDSNSPQLGVKGGQEDGAAALGFPVLATKNTTRVGGGDAVADAAGVASAVFPATSAATRPKAVTLVDKDNWQGAVAGAVLASEPLEAPILLSDGDGLPSVTKDTLDRLQPPGSDLARGAQVLLVGSEPKAPEGKKSGAIRGSDPYQLAGEIDRFVTAARGEPSEDVLVVSGEKSEFAMPAAAWAAFSGDAVLFVKQNEVPRATRDALERHDKPDIFLLGPKSVVSDGVERELRPLGRVRRVAGETPIANAIALARYSGAGFGWDINQPGHTFTLASTKRPLDAGASAALARNGVFAPLLLTDSASELPDAIESYLLDIQPGYEDDPSVQAGSNFFWILGDESTVSSETQGRIDELTELIPVDYGEPNRQTPDDRQPDQPDQPNRDQAQPDRDQ